MAGMYREFLSHINTRGVAKISHFVANIPIASEQLGINARELSIRCEAAELPGRQLVSQDVKIYGPIYKAPYQSLYQDVTLTFLETGDLGIRQFFELWMNQIFNSSSNLLSYPNNYRVKMNIIQYDVVPKVENGNGLAEIAAWTLVGAFPLSVNQMPLAWTDDGLHRTAVTLTYEYYTISRPKK